MKIFTRADTGLAKQTLQIFKSELVKEKKEAIRFSLLITLSNLLYMVISPLILSFIIQVMLTDKENITLQLQLVGLMFIMFAVGPFINRTGFLTLFNHEERVTSRLTERALRGLLQHSQGFFANQKIGSLAGDVNTFSRSYMSLLDGLFIQANSIIVSYVASLIVIGIIEPILLVPLSLLTFFIVFESLRSSQRRAEYRNQRKDMQSKLFGSIADILGNQTLVRMFGRRDNEIHSIITQREAIEVVTEKDVRLLQKSAEIRQTILFIFQIATILIAIYLYAQDAVTVAALVFTITYLTRVAGTMYNINGIIRGVEQAFLDAAKITEILSNTPDIQDRLNAPHLKVTRAHIAVKDVSFHYDDDIENEIFTALSVDILPGQRIGLAGRSGGGKSTLTQLLLRYMDVTDGTITIDGQDISRVTQESLRSAISYVPQDPYLFHRSLRENISYGKPDATIDEIKTAAKKAHAMEFIDSLPGGIDTIVGERGVKLSGGQRQRIAIARAILKDAPILILDEATSALDSESEKYIQDALSILMKDKTSIVIAHRLSTISSLDRIIVIDEGSIVEDGTHTELMSYNGLYAGLWNYQTGGLIEDEETKNN